MAVNDGGRLRLFLREGATPPIAEQQDRLRARLERVVDPGRLSITTHPARLPRDEEAAALEWFERVREWAESQEVSLSPFFESREAYDTETDAVREMVSLPVLWLVLTEGESVRAAYPHVEEAVVPVSAAVADLEATESPPQVDDAAD